MDNAHPPAISTSGRPGYGLRRGVSFCWVDGRAVFLDIHADRYACLSPAGEAAFVRLVEGQPLDASDLEVLDNVARSGPLCRDDAVGDLAPCAAPALPDRSRLDDVSGVGPIDILRAATSMLGAPPRLKLFGLEQALTRIERQKRLSPGTATAERQARVAAAFARLRVIATEQDNCLTRSLAVAGRLIAIGARPDLVVAVKLRPFYAHAWVQCDGWLINDRREFVRNYTPILVI